MEGNVNIKLAPNMLDKTNNNLKKKSAMINSIL